MKKLLFALIAIAMIATPAIAFENVTTQQAYDMATGDANTYILDVRTIAEWDWVGHPGVNKLGYGTDLDDKVINISYKIEYKKDFIINPSFISDVQGTFPDPSAVTLITMCRSGKRSVAAATALDALGYNMKNMVHGFQGDKTLEGYRAVNGWVQDGLPYSYSGEGYSD